MAKIIKIEPAETTFSLSWMTDSRCNYSCSYCPDYLHSSTASLKTLDELKSNWRSIFDKTTHLMLPYKLSFTGGEVTVNKNFLPFVEWIRENYKNRIHSIGVTTNGSASTNYYLRLLAAVEYITFSSHLEFFDQDKFINTVIDVSNYARGLGKSVHVNIMDEDDQDHIINKMKIMFDQHQVFYSINPISYANT